MISRKIVLVVTATMLAAPSAPLFGQTTLSSPGGSSIFSWGADATHVYGETFTTPASDDRLDSFSFWVGAVPSTNYRGYVYRWDTSALNATGPALFASEVMAGPSGGGFSRIDILTGGLNLESETMYVAFLGADEVGGSGSTSWESSAAGNGDGNANSSFVYLNSTNISDYTTQPWVTCYEACGNDLRYEMRFNQSVVATPEPATLVLMATGFVGLAGLARRRRSSTKA